MSSYRKLIYGIKQIVDSACWARSSAGITNVEPSWFAIQVLRPSMYGSSGGMYNLLLDSFRIPVL